MEAIKSPLQMVRELYAARSDAEDQEFCVKERFSALLADPELAAQVPVLTEDTAELLPNQCLVRFRGLVQDMLNPEYYVGEYQRPDGSWHIAKYADQLDAPLPDSCLAGGASSSRIAERRPLLLVPVPGESEWVAAPRAAAARASLAPVSGAAGASAVPKRPREDGAAATAVVDAGESMSVSMMVSDATGQTTADDGDSAASRARCMAAAGQAGASASGAGAQQQEANSVSAAAGAGVGEDLPPGCCMAYLYDDQEVKLNEVVEVVGVLSRVPELAAAHMAAGAAGQSSMLLDDVLAAHMPTSRVPRLHAIMLSTEAETPPMQAPDAAAGVPAGVAEARARVLGFLSQVLGGDDLAAEYLLLQLVGRVHHRTAASAVGVLALNLVAEPGSAAAAAAGAAGAGGSRQLSPLGGALAAAVEALVPRCVALPLSIEGLNSRPWWPRRDQNTQRIISGPLQLAANTQAVLDETVLAAGTLNEVGLRNLAALQSIMSHQRVAYDFEFFSLDQPTDAPVTVLSLGRSLLRDSVGVTLPLRPTAPLAAGASAVATAAASADLAPLRAYLAAARCEDFAISPDMEAFLQQELAGARQMDRDINERTFHTWMNLARLLALSHGEAALTRERWAAMQVLEERKHARLRGNA